MSEEANRVEIIDAFTCIGHQPDDDRDLGATALLKQMTQEGVSRALAISYAAVRYDQELGNEELLTLCKEQPGLLPIAIVNPAPYFDLEASVCTYTRARFAGLRFTPYRQGWSLHSAPFKRALACANATGLPISVETGPSGDASWLAELSVNMNVPLVLGLVTYGTMGEVLAVLEDHLNLFLELTRPVSPGVVEILVERLGSDRLLYASGAPVWAVAPSLEMIRQAEIPADAITAILGGNARRIYGLTGAEAAR